MIDLTPIFQAVIALLAALITYKLIPWIMSKTDEQQQANLQAAANVAAFAAEQIFGAHRGEEKLDYALRALERAGYKIDKTMAREAIEKAVRELSKDPREMLAAIAKAAAEKDGEDEEPEADDDTAEPVPELRDWQKECPQPFEDCPQPAEEPEEGAPGDTEAPPDDGQGAEAE